MGFISHSRAEEKGRSLWNSYGDKPDFYPFYIARSRHADVGIQLALADVERALELARNDWRAGLFASKFYLYLGDILKAEELDWNFYGKNPQNYYMGLHYAKVLELSKNYSAYVSLLQRFQVLPNEGANEGRTIWRNANIGNVLDCMKAKKYRKALESIGLVRQRPANLGVGKSYLVDERHEDFIELQCNKKLKDNRSAREMQDKITGKTVQQNLSFDANDFLTIWVLKETGNKSEGDQIMNGLLTKNPSSKSVHWCNTVYSGDLERAKTITKEVDGNDQTFVFPGRMLNELLKVGFSSQ